MRICVVQTDIVWEDKTANMRRYEAYFKEAASYGAELIVFPEMSLTGFSMDSALAESCDGKTCAYFGRMALQYGLNCVFGYTERCDDKVCNRLAVADQNGRVLRRYTKMHPFGPGGELALTAGDEPVCFSLNGMNIGLTICYDLRFPELYRQLSKICGCVIVSANWPASRREHWITLLKARAIEDQCYIIGCNRVGIGDGIEYCGDSMVVAPDGTVMAMAEQGAEQIISADVFTYVVENVRADFPVLRDRRPDIYRNFYE